MTHHMITEDHIHIKCIYCKHELNEQEWKSEWNAEHHYKFTVCDNCGRKTHKTMEFHGSGHDEWDVRAFSSLETKVFEKTKEGQLKK